MPNVSVSFAGIGIGAHTLASYSQGINNLYSEMEERNRYCDVHYEAQLD